MARQAREISASGVYHIIVRGIDKMQIFEDSYDNMRFLQILDTIDVEDFSLLAYCLMGNHCHLLLKCPVGENGAKTLEIIMKKLGTQYVFHYNRRYYRNGSLFGGRFTSVPVDKRHYLFRVLRYIHNNPYKAGIASDMADYTYTSFHDYFTAGYKPICKVNTDYVFDIIDREKLYNFHLQNELKCDDFGDFETITQFLNDDDAYKSICDIIGCKVPSDISRMPQKLRDVALSMLCDLPISIRQMSRLTGVSRGIITRIKNNNK